MGGDKEASVRTSSHELVLHNLRLSHDASTQPHLARNPKASDGMQPTRTSGNEDIEHPALSKMMAVPLIYRNPGFGFGKINQSQWRLMEQNKMAELLEIMTSNNGEQGTTSKYARY
ncbi:hypothetical protein CIB48_g7114 [Xylaria polymorpha]|nr:hypothetical protein CIB48_g7114 [Xylaria polymorpha]